MTAFPYLCSTNVLSLHFKFQSTHPAAEGNSPGLWVLMKALLKCWSESRRRKTKKRPILFSDLGAQQRHRWLFPARDVDATARTVMHTGVVQLSPFSKLPLAIFHQQPPCIFSLASSFNLGDEIHSSDRVAPPTRLLSSTFAHAPSFLLLTARCTADVKAASRHLEAKSNVPVNNSTDDGKEREWGEQEIQRSIFVWEPRRCSDVSLYSWAASLH